MSEAKDHYRAFISYSHSDAKWAKWLHQSLERYVVPIDVYPPDEKSESEESGRLRKLTPISDNVVHDVKGSVKPGTVALWGNLEAEYLGP